MKQLLQTFLLGLMVITLSGCPDSSDSDTAPTIVGGASTSGGSSNTGGTSASFGGEGFISFVSADPGGSIGIRGTDAIANQSVVTFSVTDSQGNPIAGQAVSFSLNTSLGGIALSSSQQVTNAEGLVTTTVSSGDVATVVRVTAESTRNGVTATAQSSQLAITTGIADQDSFSVSISEFNIEGNNVDGITTEITARAADRYNNPVADNTAINFTAEGGSIPGSCLTVDGACSVNLVSQNPRPADGRVTILVSAIGEESFNDVNPSNGRYDDAETFTDSSREAFRDDNRNDARDSNEIYIDYNSNQSYDLADGLFNGLLCNGPANCSQRKTTTVFQNVVVVFADSFFNITATPSAIALGASGTAAQTVVVNVKGSSNGQVPPVGTTITAETTQGTLGTPTNFTMTNTTFDPASGTAGDPSRFTFSIAPGSAAGSGTLTITVTTPRGNITTATLPVTQS